MAESFFPANSDAVSTPNKLTLSTAKYVIRTTLFNPITNAREPLPEHIWELLVVTRFGAQAITRGTVSDNDGVSGISPPTTLPPGNFSFLLVPNPKPIRAGYFKDREAWVDLDAAQKVTAAGPNGARDWATAPKTTAIERRRLLRLPAWSTQRKALFGGFFQSPTGTTLFGNQGVILPGELKGFGTPAVPWDLQLDFNWVQARVKFFFFDWLQSQQQGLPPGLVCEATREETNSQSVVIETRMGAGTPISATDGTFFMFLEGDQTSLNTCQIHFTAPTGSFVDLTSKATPSPDTRLTNTPPIPVNGDDRNLLPSEWHSHGMRGNFTTSLNPNPAPADKTWDDLRADIATDPGGNEPTFIFHLDDVVLTDPNSVSFSLQSGSKPPTLFDHFLKIINPDPNAPYQTQLLSIANTSQKRPMVERVIPADAVYAVGPPPGTPKVLELSTRLIHFEARFHDLRDDRVKRRQNKQTRCIGARAAKEGQHDFTTVNQPLKGNLLISGLLKNAVQMHVIEVPNVLDPVAKVQLQHILVYIPVALSLASDFNMNPPAPAKPGSAVLIDAQIALGAAGDHWSAGHPGSPLGQNKGYALVPNDPTKRISRFRVFFAESTRSPTLTLTVRDSDPKARSETTPALIVFQNVKIDYFTAGVTADATAAAAGGGFQDSGDKAQMTSQTLTHEFGHAMGLVDEYVERVIPQRDMDKSLGDPTPTMPSFAQVDEGFSDYRPYYTDIVAMMISNNLPRLRHFWHHAKNLQSQLGGRLKDGPYQLTHETFNSGKLVYTVPPNDVKAPWDALFLDVRIPGGHGECALFPLGSDEGTAETMFRTPTGSPVIPAQPMQGILVVRSRLRFVFDPLMTPVEMLDVMHLNFHQKIYDLQESLKIRFVLVANAKMTPVTKFPRIAVLFQPLYEFGELPLLSFESADLIFDIAKTGPKRPNPFLVDLTNIPPKGTRLNFALADFLFEPAWRLVLGAPTVQPGAKTSDTGVLRSTDLNAVAALVSAQLNEPPGSRDILIF